MAKLFVANFPFSADNDQLREFFSKIGDVKDAKVVTDNESGRSRGFGFVEMASQELATKAIAELNGSEWDGRPIKVSEDKNQSSDAGRGSSSYRKPQREYNSERSFDNSRPNNNGGERGAQSGFFRAQPFNADFRRRAKIDPFVEDESLKIDYKDIRLLRRFISERGKILPRRMTSLNAHNQRVVATAVKRAQHLALLPVTGAGAKN